MAGSDGILVAVGRLKRMVAHLAGVRQSWEDPHLNPLAETS